MTGSSVDVVRAYLAADVPVLLWGAPGTGKTAALLAEADRIGAYAEVLVGSTLDPVDVGGYLFPSGDRVRSEPPPWARRLRTALDERRPTWLFLDELSCAPPSVQAALLRVVQDRRVGELDLRGCRVVAASNPSDTAADGGELSAATANRWAHVTWVPDVATWATGTLSGWGKPHPNARAAAMAASVAAFVQRSPAALLAVPEDLARAGRAWPSPRSWTAAIAACACAGDDLLLRVAEGCVGAAAVEWHAFHVARDLPDPEDVLSGRAPIPDRGDRAAATLAAVAAAASSEHPQRDERIRSSWRLVVGQRADVGLAAARALLGASAYVPEEASQYATRLRAGGVM